MKRIFVIVLSILSFVSCIDESYYGESNLCNITSFEMEGQLSCEITTKNGRGYIYVSMPEDVDKSNLRIIRAVISPLSKFDRDISSIRNFSNNVTVKVIAEDGKTFKNWDIIIVNTGTDSQIPYSDMKKWTIALDENGNQISLSNNEYAYFPGEEGKYSPWQHAARANKINGFFSVTPQPSSENSEYALVETKAYPVGNLVNSGIVTGALFTGKFCFDSRHLPVVGSDPNPRKLIDFGIPFTHKPSAVRFDIRYTPGDVMKDGKGKTINENDPEGRPYKDSCDIYFLLQNRSLKSDTYYRVGTAWLRNGEVIGENGFVTITLPFVYGQPTQAEVQEKPYMNIGGIRGEVSFYKFSFNGTTYDKELMKEEFGDKDMEVDHIIGLFSSSAYGDMFWGAPGSRLEIKNVELIYE